jgi:type I restriction enzyme S subunit
MSEPDVTIDPTVVKEWKRYPGYKDSGVEWLGEVPEGWDIVRLKFGVSLINQKIDGQTLDLPYVGLENIESGTGRFIQSDESLQPEGQSNRFKSGDVLFGKLRPYLAKALRTKYTGICTSELLVLRPRHLTQDFLLYYLLNKEFIQTVNASTYGTKMPRANWDNIGNLPILIPPLPEQCTIAAFLDRETARIDALVEKKRRLVDLLAEKRQALITHAVTKGLNPSVEVKDSGVEWIGEVPKHWGIVALRRVTKSRCDGPFGSGLKSTHYADCGVRVIRLQNIGHAQFKNEDAAYIPAEYYAALGDHSVIAGDLLIAGLGDEKIPPGRACVAPESIEPAMVKADCFRFRLDPKRANAFFVALQLTSTAFVAASILSSGATRQRINLQSMSSRQIILPPLPEQCAIAAFLDQETARIDTITDTINQQIEKLHEYRTALISAAVTGKTDVREEVETA